MSKRAVRKACVGIAAVGIVLAIWAGETYAGVDDIPRAYYGQNGVPVRFTVSASKFAVRFKPGISRTQMTTALQAVSGVEAPNAAELSALENRDSLTMLRFARNTKREAPRAVFAQIRALPNVDEVQPVLVFEPGHEEVLTPYAYASFPSNLPEEKIRQTLAAAGVEIVKRVDYSRIGKIGYRLRIPKAAALNAITAANRLAEQGGATEAAPVFSHPYSTECSAMNPNDPKYGSGPSYPRDPDRQYDLYNESSTGHINMPEAWGIIYENDPNGDFIVKPQFNQNDVVIACIDNGVMLDYRASAYPGIPSNMGCGDCSTPALNPLYYGHPDLIKNQWFNLAEINGTPGVDDDGNGVIDDYFGWDFLRGGLPETDPRFAHRFWPYPDRDQEGAPDHGTHAMGVADGRGNNGEGLAGVCWHAKIMPVRYEGMHLNPVNGGDTLFDLHMADALTYAARTGAHVLSFLASVRSYNPEVHDAILDARSRGRIIVVPAGNGNLNIGDPESLAIMYPAVLPEVICVGATNQYDKRCDYHDWQDIGGIPKGSDYGNILDVMAPSHSGSVGSDEDMSPWGTNFPINPIDPLYTGGSGTSTAFPHACGLAALLLTVDPALSHAEIQAIMQWSAKDLSYPGDAPDPEHMDWTPRGAAGRWRDEQTGWGLLNGGHAVQWAMRKRFAVKNASGQNVFSIDNQGYFAINGDVVPNADYTGQLEAQSAFKEFIVRKEDGTVLALLRTAWSVSESDPARSVWPTLYLKGCLKKQQGNLSPPTTSKSFIVKDSEGNVVAYISSEDDCDKGIPVGSLVLKGDAFIGKNPDPYANRTELLFADDFEDGSYSNCPPKYGSLYYSNCPAWDSESGSGDWQVSTGNGDKMLFNAGSYSAGPPEHAHDRIRISQPSPDLDINIDLKCNTAQPLKIGFRENTLSDTVYAQVDPSTSVVGIYKYSSATTTLLASHADPPTSTFQLDTWYEMHIQASGQKVHVWMRQRDEIGVGTRDVWHYVITDEDFSPQADTQLSGTQAYFSLLVDHTTEVNGRWQIDNVTLNTFTFGFEPQSVFYEDFQDASYTDCPGSYSRTLYTSCPTWSSITGTGDWTMASSSTEYFVQNAGSYSTQHPTDALRIAQPVLDDVEVSADLRCTVARPIRVSFREGSTQSIYVQPDPTAGTVKLYANTTGTPTELCTSNFTWNLNTWYEMHILAQYTFVSVWLRTRDDAEQGSGYGWTQVIEVNNIASRITEPQAYFTLTVDHSNDTNGRWDVDNAIVSTPGTNNYPWPACSGCQN